MSDDTRGLTSRIEKLHFAATDPFRVCLGLAAAAAEDKEIVRRVVSGHQITIDGQVQMAWLIETDGGMRYSIAHSDSIAIYGAAKVLENQAPIMQTDLGAVIGRVPNETVDLFLGRIANLPVGAAADLLLRRAKYDGEDIAISARQVSHSPQSIG